MEKLNLKLDDTVKEPSSQVDKIDACLNKGSIDGTLIKCSICDEHRLPLKKVSNGIESKYFCSRCIKLYV